MMKPKKAQPDGQKIARRGESGGDDSGGHINAGAYDRAYDQERGIDQAEPS
jgi:hypothetical protein